jgi:hypothetical protein
MSALCQKQTFCAAARISLFDHLSVRKPLRIPLAQELKPLANKVRLLDRDPRNVAGRVCQALHQTATHWIECNGKDDRNSRYCLP